TEEASPGNYAVTLDSGIRVELTATTRVGLQRYTFPRDGWANVVLDLTHRDKLMSGKIEASGAVVTGHRFSKGWASDQRVFFRSEFSRTPEAVYERDGPEGDRVFLARFRVTAGEQILVKTGIAGTDEAGAALNLSTEHPGWDFDATRRTADAAWNAELGKIDASGGTPEATVNFYTALYRTMIAPNTWNDVDGRYRGMDGQIHTADHTVYTVFSLWDTFRALHPLLTLIDEDRTRDFVRTMLLHHEQSGRLPVWELAADETDTMIGYHAVPVILDAAVKGIDGFDERQALRAMVETATTDIEGLADFNARGFLSVEDESESVSRSLEYAYNSWVVARMAERLGEGPLAHEFDRRALGYRSMLDDEGFARPRQNGGWLAPFEPREVNSHFTEANSWQYSFFVPHDLEGWIDWRGGPLAV
ncbi:MAG: GH92 family glycosyl hydrolase, partial [Bacteroidota bacterium]